MPVAHLTDIVVRSLKGSERYETTYDQSLPAFGVRCGIRSKTWVILRGRGRERVTIGTYPDMPLAKARKEAKRLLGSEPEDKASTATWRFARDLFIEEHYQGKGDYTRYQAKRLLTKHFRKLDHTVLADLTDQD